MKKAHKEKQKPRGLAAIVITVVLIGCAPMQSGRWYDSESDVPLQPRIAKPKAEKKVEPEAAEPGRVSQIWSRMRETLDRRPEARKKKQAMKTRASTNRGGSGMVVVAKGDTYYSLSQTHQVPLRALLETNNARAPYVLSPGDRVKLPTQAFYQVKKSKRKK